MKDVGRNLIPVEAIRRRHEQPNPEAAPDQTLDDHQQLDLQNQRLRPTASRVARLRPSPAKKESLEKLARKMIKGSPFEAERCHFPATTTRPDIRITRQGQPKIAPSEGWLEETLLMSTDPRCRALN
ncbi:hypothetical protein TYRP_020536 [Tyrophagus putrescentiae]|nr:hypothetical protein TYRP_020536 [Tyrophagus putrescentiae]